MNRSLIYSVYISPLTTHYLIVCEMGVWIDESIQNADDSGWFWIDQNRAIQICIRESCCRMCLTLNRLNCMGGSATVFHRTPIGYVIRTRYVIISSEFYIILRRIACNSLLIPRNSSSSLLRSSPTCSPVVF